MHRKGNAITRSKDGASASELECTRYIVCTRINEPFVGPIMRAALHPRNELKAIAIQEHNRYRAWRLLCRGVNFITHRRPNRSSQRRFGFSDYDWDVPTKTRRPVVGQKVFCHTNSSHEGLFALRSVDLLGVRRTSLPLDKHILACKFHSPAVRTRPNRCFQDRANRAPVRGGFEQGES